MKTTNNTPQWAIELVEQVCRDYNRTLPGELEWKDTSGPHASGYCSYARTSTGRKVYSFKVVGSKKNRRYKRTLFRGKIAIKAGTDYEGNRMVLLHELAHWVVVRNKSMGHTVKFWRMAWELFHCYEADLERCLKSEGAYKRFALEVYDKEYGGK